MALWIFSENISNGKKIKVFNYGNMRRDFTYVDDIVNGVCASLFNEGLEQYEIFNLGNHRSEQLLKMISIIEDELGIKADMEMLPLQPGDVPESFADIEKARAKLGYEPETPIEVGIPNFIKWYKEYPDLAKRVVELRSKD
jgi:UDP-glucuronate 4-epimerase